MKMRAVFANGKVDREGDRFTPEVLRKMAESPVPVPLLLNFNPEAIIGEICCFEYNEERQEVSGTIILVPDMNIPEGCVPVVGYQCDPKRGKDLEKQFVKIFSIGVTDKPSTPDTRFEEIEGELGISCCDSVKRDHS